MSRSLAGLLVLSFVLPAAAAPRRNPTANWPELKTPEQRMRALQTIGQSFDRKSTRLGYTSADLDRELERYIRRGTSTRLAPVVDDETFLRRVTLDLTGQVPSPDDLAAFAADNQPRKRAKKIDELLSSDAYAGKWARYWREVIFHDAPGLRNQQNPQAFEDWLVEEFAAGTGWDLIVGEMLSAIPARKKDVRVQDNGWNQDYGPNNFVLAANRKPEHLADRTARIFMGISIGCAECHDHPFDDWKREQFHELASFFSNYRYFMTDAEDPSERHLMQPRFLLGEKPPENLKADQKRVVLAAYLIYNPDNYWFARAYVNRVWSELVGDGFYSVDSLGPDGEVVHKLVVNKLSAQFRAEGFDPRWILRVICNSNAYQREARPAASTKDLFTSVRATRLRPWEVADRVGRVTGVDPNEKRLRAVRRTVEQTFEQNPSTPHADLEGTVQQALLFMNNGTINGLLAGGPLAKRLRGIKDHEAVVDEAFLAVLARRPTKEETQRYVQHLKTTKNRGEAVSDLLWVLVNSAEFLTKT